MRGRRARPVPGWWIDLADGFLRSLLRRNRRPNTIKSYRYELRAFGSWMLGRGITCLLELRGPDLEAWQDQMLEQQLAVRSQVVRISALRGCLKWAAMQEVALSSPTLWLRLESPRIPQLLPRPIPSRDLALILATIDADEPDDLWRLRTRALFWVLYSSGARISEALSLRRGSTQPDGSHVIQKGGRPHILLLSQKAIAAVIDYDRRRDDDGPSMFASLFPGHRGEPLKKYEAQMCWNRLCQQLGIPRFKSHQVRHSCATSLRRQHADIVLIARHLGHRGLAMVQNYTLIDVEDRLEALSLLDSSVGTSVKLHAVSERAPSAAASAFA